MKLIKLNPDGTEKESILITDNCIIELNNGKKYFITEKNVHEIKINKSNIQNHDK
jgi:hypothetical protein